MIKCNLSHGYYFEQDGMDLTLRQTYEVKSKDDEVKQADRVVGYFRRLDKLVERYLKEVHSLVGEQYADSIIQYADIIDKANTIAVTAIVCAIKKGGKYEK